MNGPVSPQGMWPGEKTSREDGLLKDIPKFYLGDVVQTRKKHPCGSDRWEIVRLGADIRIKCLKCGRHVLLPRIKFEKRVKKILERGNPE